MSRNMKYRFERAERDRAKAAKKAERLKAKKERAISGGEDHGDDAEAVENNTEDAAESDEHPAERD